MMQKCILEQNLETQGSTKLHCFVGMHPTEAAKPVAEHVPTGISFTDVMTHIRNCIKACAQQ